MGYMVNVLMGIYQDVRPVLSVLFPLTRESELGSHGEVADEFAVIVKALWSGQYRCITPRDFKVRQNNR